MKKLIVTIVMVSFLVSHAGYAQETMAPTIAPNYEQPSAEGNAHKHKPKKAQKSKKKRHKKSNKKKHAKKLKNHSSKKKHTKVKNL